MKTTQSAFKKSRHSKTTEEIKKEIQYFINQINWEKKHKAYSFQTAYIATLEAKLEALRWVLECA